MRNTLPTKQYIHVEYPQTSHVGAYRIRPNTPTNPRGCFQGVCDTPLQGNWVKCGYSNFLFYACPLNTDIKKQRQTSQSASAYKSQHIYAETRKYKISKLLIAAHCRIPTARCMMHPR